MRANDATVRSQLLESKRIRRPQVLHAVQRRIRPDQDLSTRAQRRDNLVAVRQSLTTRGIRRGRRKVVDVLLRGKPHKHRILRGRRPNRCLRAKTDQMPVRRGHQRILALCRRVRDRRGPCCKTRGRRPLVNPSVHVLQDQLLTKVIKLPNLRQKLQRGRRRTRRAPRAKAPCTDAPAKVDEGLVAAGVYLVGRVGRAGRCGR